ncbi:hypothetical protein TIFTF001_053456 [Ficus carica]|uniref:Uncharacterized protein n=2 Tax=Ficus carica TaxID=3494 RepID=A0AA88EBU6_FICCA|nr:hypothetical protein TIFTF001_053456 [Ficus carica]
MTALVEPLGALVASATPMTALVEPQGPHDARALNAQSPNRPPARARARVVDHTSNPRTSPVVPSRPSDRATLWPPLPKPTGTVGGPPRVRGTVEGPPGQPVAGADRSTPPAGQEQRVDVFCEVSETSDNVWQAKNNVQMDSAKFHRHRITFGEGQEQRADGFCKVS